ncbi:serine protease [Flavobacterium beibuense]|uniref:Trypsin domain protein n=1 Tax=Flavobacterium beibuense TaxID=657326 RepID=A0A444WEJ8_9FLAO|nr:serine protease [Flavobacterium beibuense]RYJ44278.1 Trypsin domain protein [Flavobacterium beibuense]
MIDTTNLADCTWKVINPGGQPKGTAFFVSDTLLLTSLHVVSLYLSATFTIQDRSGKILNATVKDHCQKNDLAIIEVLSYASDKYVPLRSEEPVNGANSAAFGFPATVEGLKVGKKIETTISNIITVEHPHDIVLDVNGGILTTYSGFSGAGVINAQHEVTSILRFQDVNSVGAVSVKKAEEFISRNGITIISDELDDFSHYLKAAFEHTPDDFKTIGSASAALVAQRTSPQQIAEALKGKLIIPTRAGSLKEIIAYLKSQTTLSSELWRTWLELLSYVQLLKGSYTNINAISISLPNAEVSKMIPGVETKIQHDIELTLQFFFAEGKDYFSIAKKYLTEKKIEDSLRENHCHLFHSHNPLFGNVYLTSDAKKNIIHDISSPTGSGLLIPDNINIGVLSFAQLTSHVAASTTLQEATTNLIKIFTDAIK